MLDSHTPADNAPDSSPLTAIVAAIVSDTGRSSGSLESNASAGSSSLSAPSLDTSNSHSTSSATSAASSTDPSPCPSILIRSNSETIIPPPRSNTSSPSITFAPLPQTEPRKRSSSHQLGVAARSRLLRHRRMLRENGVDPHSVPSPYGQGSGVAGGKGYVYQDSFEQPHVKSKSADENDEEASRRHRNRVVSDPNEDALMALGKLMKGAGKTLLKSLSMRDMRSKEREAAAKLADAAAAEPLPLLESEGHEGQVPARGGSLRERRVTGERTEAVHLFDGDDDRRRSEDGGVCEEDIPQEAWKMLLSDVAPTSEPESDTTYVVQHVVPGPEVRSPSSEMSRSGSKRKVKATVDKAAPSKAHTR
ncbi:hypothetical protein C8Q74DRAFT_101258 [Fomes fomentarius]|nr:hypothetical protein C8Q74DRAFT_101258 [Fomes fomentarius]